MQPSDKLWLDDQERHGWIMPAASWWKRLPIIRHCRTIYHGMRAEDAARNWMRCGIGLGLVNQYDRWVLYGIARGWERPTNQKDRK